MSIKLYAHHVLHDPSVLEDDAEEVDEQLRALGHDWSEEWFFSDDMQHALVVGEFGSSADLVTHFTAMIDSGFDAAFGTALEVPHMDFVGDVDAEARAVLARLPISIHYLSPAPSGT